MCRWLYGQLWHTNQFYVLCFCSFNASTSLLSWHSSEADDVTFAQKVVLMPLSIEMFEIIALILFFLLFACLTFKIYVNLSPDCMSRLCGSFLAFVYVAVLSLAEFVFDFLPFCCCC